MHDLWSSDLAPLIFVAFFGVVGWLGYPIATALRRRLEGKGDGAADHEVQALRAELAELRERLETTPELVERLVELEERVDFAERVLARGGTVPNEATPDAGA